MSNPDTFFEEFMADAAIENTPAPAPTMSPMEAETTPAPTPIPAPKKVIKRPGREKEITPSNLQVMEFLGKFPGASVEALSLIQVRQPNRFHGAGLRSIGGMKETIGKLRSMGMADFHRDPGMQGVFWSLTQSGLEALEAMGIGAENLSSLHNVARSRAAHYRAIAMVAAQLISPAGIFRQTLGIGPLGLSQVVSELEMRRAFAPERASLQQAKKQGRRAIGAAGGRAFCRAQSRPQVPDIFPSKICLKPTQTSGPWVLPSEKAASAKRCISRIWPCIWMPEGLAARAKMSWWKWS